ncbi:hypothetical protein LJC36_04795 [Desulfovibrio sp. OttesenSCG-928-C14]|nr:hypothetical protein [Desulfovibrio sp. OttesenSCG-928-C14]
MSGLPRRNPAHSGKARPALLLAALLAALLSASCAGYGDDGRDGPEVTVRGQADTVFTYRK